MISLKHPAPKSFFDPESKEIIVSTDIKRIWAVELDLLAEFDAVCRTNGIKYALFAGALLGAIRHGGIIPWDNDIDVMMLREEYDRFCAIAPKAFSAPYSLQTDANTPFAAKGHAKLRNSSTTAILRAEMSGGRCVFDYDQGVFLDIFPLDAVPDDEAERDAFLNEVNIARRNVFAVRGPLTAYRNRKRFNLGVRSRWIGAWLTYKERLTGRPLLSEAVRKFEETAQKFNGRGMKNVSTVSFGSGWERKYLERSWIEDVVDHDFAYLKCLVPRQAEVILDRCYGNWRKHVVGGDSHGGVFFDVDKPYTEYLD